LCFDTAGRLERAIAPRETWGELVKQLPDSWKPDFLVRKVVIRTDVFGADYRDLLSRAKIVVNRSTGAECNELENWMKELLPTGSERTSLTRRNGVGSRFPHSRQSSRVVRWHLIIESDPETTVNNNDSRPTPDPFFSSPPMSSRVRGHTATSTTNR
jgi:hypothetical protein